MNFKELLNQAAVKASEKPPELALKALLEVMSERFDVAPHRGTLSDSTFIRHVGAAYLDYQLATGTITPEEL